MRWTAALWIILAACGAEPDPWVGTWRGTVTTNGTPAGATATVERCGAYVLFIGWPAPGGRTLLAAVEGYDGHSFPDGVYGVPWSGAIDMVDGSLVGDAMFVVDGVQVEQHLDVARVAASIDDTPLCQPID